MEHIAIDLGGRESQVCVRDGAGRIVEERRVATDRLRGFLRKRAPARVIIETCAEAFVTADVAIELGHEVRIVPATLVRSLGVGARGIKTDQRDARTLSEVSTRIELPSVHLPSQVARRRKALCTSRDVLVSARTKLINHCRGFLRTQGAKMRSGDSSTFVARIQQCELALPKHVQSVVHAVDELSTQIHQLDDELRELVKNDPLCQRLMTVPGVGPVTAVRFVSAVDEVARFGDAHALQSYLGLVPGERSSGDSKQRTGLTKAGSAAVRWVLMQAAWSAWRHRSQDPMVVWARRVAERRGKHVAVAALARKLVGILYAMWRNGTRYDASRGAQRIDADGVIHGPQA